MQLGGVRRGVLCTDGVFLGVLDSGYVIRLVVLEGSCRAYSGARIRQTGLLLSETRNGTRVRRQD